MKEAHDHSRVSPAGRALGEQMARLSDNACEALAKVGEADERCKSCAFRMGTVPNGCLVTQSDALKAVIEDVPFMCHQANRNGAVCHGWFAARVQIDERALAGKPLPVTKCPWEFSPPDDVEVPS